MRKKHPNLPYELSQEGLGNSRFRRCKD